MLITRGSSCDDPRIFLAACRVGCYHLFLTVHFFQIKYDDDIACGSSCSSISIESLVQSHNEYVAYMKNNVMISC